MARSDDVSSPAVGAVNELVYQLRKASSKRERDLAAFDKKLASLRAVASDARTQKTLSRLERRRVTLEDEAEMIRTSLGAAEALGGALLEMREELARNDRASDSAGAAAEVQRLSEANAHLREELHTKDDVIFELQEVIDLLSTDHTDDLEPADEIDLDDLDMEIEVAPAGTPAPAGMPPPPPAVAAKQTPDERALVKARAKKAKFEEKERARKAKQATKEKARLEKEAKAKAAGEKRALERADKEAKEAKARAEKRKPKTTASEVANAPAETNAAVQGGSPDLVKETPGVLRRLLDGVRHMDGKPAAESPPPMPAAAAAAAVPPAPPPDADDDVLELDELGVEVDAEVDEAFDDSDTPPLGTPAPGLDVPPPSRGPRHPHLSGGYMHVGGRKPDGEE